MKLLRRRCLVAAGALAPFVAALAAPAIVDLDVPAVREGLREQQPERYAKVMALLEDAQRMPDKQVEGWLRTRHNADSVQLGLLLVSLPPKRRLSFSLDSVAYRATIVVALPPARVVPAR